MSKQNMTPSTFDPIFGSVQVTLIVLNNQFFKIHFRGFCVAGNADHNNHRNVKRQFHVILTNFLVSNLLLISTENVC